MSQNSFMSSSGVEKERKQGFALIKTSNVDRNTVAQTDVQKSSDMIKSSEGISMPTTNVTVKSSSSSGLPNSQNHIAPFKSALESVEDNVLARKLRESENKGVTVRSGSQPSRKLTPHDAFASALRHIFGLSTNDAFTSSDSTGNTLSQSQSQSQSQTQRANHGSGGSFFSMSTIQNSAQVAEKKRKSEGKVKFKALIGECLCGCHLLLLLCNRQVL
jgi:hypothetical protein